jgi:hypothetical protein
MSMTATESTDRQPGPVPGPQADALRWIRLQLGWEDRLDSLRRRQGAPSPSGAAPSCRNQPSVSSTPHDSANRPSTTRYTVVPGLA